MGVSKLLVAAAAATLVSAPVIAAPAPANPAASLSLANASGVKAASTSRNGSKLVGLTGPALFLAIAGGLGATFLVVKAVSNDSSGSR